MMKFSEMPYERIDLDALGAEFDALTEKVKNAKSGEEVLEAFRDYYSKNSRIKTAPYDGILAALKLLSGKGYKIAVISNKIDSAVKELNRDFFAEYIPVAIGDREGMKKKPAPDSLYEAMKLLGSKKEECLYIGDSDVDIETAQNAGIPCIGCAWGFRGRDFLREHGLDDAWILEQPTEIPKFLETLEEKDIESV